MRAVAPGCNMIHTIVDWPGVGSMALGEAFRRLELNFNGPVCISLLRP
jgi:hypothetical protein